MISDIEWRRRAKLLIQIGVSAVILFSGVFIILSKSYSDASVAWAAGVIGIVIGYWLR